MISHNVDPISRKFAIVDAIAVCFSSCFLFFQEGKTQLVPLRVSSNPSFSQGGPSVPLGIFGRGGAL
tara:strand:+ start:1107 stop:1307 length:201 start_codon:yes stop_codon:yes gene_type:complete